MKLKALAAVWVLLFVMSITASIAGVWVAGSAITSGIKAGTKSCGQTYAIESIVSGDWFCPVENGRKNVKLKGDARIQIVTPEHKDWMP